MWNSACFIRCGFCCCLLSSVWLGEPFTVRGGCYLLCRAHTSAAHGEEVSIQTTWLIGGMAHGARWVPLNMKRLLKRPFAWLSFQDTQNTAFKNRVSFGLLLFFLFLFCFVLSKGIIYTSIVSKLLLSIELDLWSLNGWIKELLSYKIELTLHLNKLHMRNV